MENKIKRCPKCDGMLYSRKAPYDKSEEAKLRKKLLKQYFAENLRCFKCGEDFNFSDLKFHPLK